MLTDWLIFLDYLEEKGQNTCFLRFITPIIFGIRPCNDCRQKIGFGFCYGFNNGNGFGRGYHHGFGYGNGFGYDNGYDQGNGYGDGIEDFLYQDHFIEHEIYKDCMEEEH